MRELKLRNICLGSRGMRVIATAAARGELDELEALTLCHNFIDDACVEHLTENALHLGGFPRLRLLNVSNNYIGDRGIQALTKAALCGGVLSELACLRIAANGDIGPETIGALAAALLDGALASLKELVVPVGHERHFLLSSACRSRKVKLV